MRKLTSSRLAAKRIIAVISLVSATLIVVVLTLFAFLLPHQVGGKINPHASVILPNYFMNGMVFQRNKSITIRGTTDPDTQLTVTINDKKHSSSATTVADEDGAFRVDLDAPPAQLKPYTLTVSSGNTILAEINKTYVGDVFLAAGQSNMDLNYYDYYRLLTNDEDTVVSNLPQTIDDQHVHFIVLAHEASEQTSGNLNLPLRDYTDSKWVTADFSNAERLGYLPQFFAENLRQDNPNIPVGIIQTSWNGTPIYRHLQGGDIYNTHILPLSGFHIAGILWYQGENDSFSDEYAYAYQSNFSTLIDDYRTVFEDQTLPFLYVQLARYSHGGTNWPIIRQAQMKTALLKKNVYMTVSIDTDKGTEDAIHPLGKDILADRLAAQWEDMVKQKTVSISPMPVSAKHVRGDSSTVSIAFDMGTDANLCAMTPQYTLQASPTNYAKKSAQDPVGFQVAGTNGQFVKASARIVGRTVWIHSADVEEITQVRYLWDPSPSNSPLLYSDDGLPASPFTIAVSEQ